MTEANASAPATETPIHLPPPPAAAAAPATHPHPAGEAPKEKRVYIWGVGRRKSAVARVRLALGSGKVEINGRSLNDYFTAEKDRKAIFGPLEVTNTGGRMDVLVNAAGGGATGQTGAIVMGLGRALAKYDKALEVPLRNAGFLTRDSRMKERKKYGQRAGHGGDSSSPSGNVMAAGDETRSDGEMSDVVVIVDDAAPCDFKDLVSKLQGLGFEVESVDNANGVIEGAIKTEQIGTIKKIPCVKYVRSVFNYLAEDDEEDDSIPR